MVDSHVKEPERAVALGACGARVTETLREERAIFLWPPLHYPRGHQCECQIFISAWASLFCKVTGCFNKTSKVTVKWDCMLYSLESSSSLVLSLHWPADRSSMFPGQIIELTLLVTENVASGPVYNHVVARMLIFPLAFKLVGHEGVTKSIYRYFCGQ